MLVAIVGVVEDGSVRGVDVPLDTAHGLRVPIGEDLTLRVKVLRPDGTACRVLAPVVGTLTIKKSSQQLVVSAGQGAQFSASGTIAEPSVLLFHASSAVLAGLPAGRYVYDVWLTLSAGINTRVVRLSELWVEPAAALL